MVHLLAGIRILVVEDDDDSREVVSEALTSEGATDAARDWRANFFPVGIAHSIVGGSAWEPTPWRAVRRDRASPPIAR